MFSCSPVLAVGPGPPRTNLWTRSKALLAVVPLIFGRGFTLALGPGPATMHSRGLGGTIGGPGPPLGIKPRPKMAWTWSKQGSGANKGCRVPVFGGSARGCRPPAAPDGLPALSFGRSSCALIPTPASKQQCSVWKTPTFVQCFLQHHHLPVRVWGGTNSFGGRVPGLTAQAHTRVPRFSGVNELQVEWC